MSEKPGELTYNGPPPVYPPAMKQIQANLQVMLGSAIAHDDGEWVTGYTIKTGALHRIIGLMQTAGYPVSLPAMTTPSSVPAQGEAMEVLRELIEAASHLYAASNGNDSDEISARLRVRNTLNRARALVAASPCAAQPTQREDAKRARPPSDEEPWVVADDEGMRMTFRREDSARQWYADRRHLMVNPTLTFEPATSAAAQGGQQPVADACHRLNDALEKIGDYAHDRSTGPAVPDALWEVRRMAYEAMEEVPAAPAAPAAPLTARMLTGEERRDVARNMDPAHTDWVLRDWPCARLFSTAVIRKFCDVNGITLTDTKKPSP